MPVQIYYASSLIICIHNNINKINKKSGTEMNEGKTQHYIFVNVKGRSVPAANNTLNQV